MSDGWISLRRVRHDEFEIESGGVVVKLYANECIDDLPRCFRAVEELYCAVKGAHGHLARRSAP